MRGIFEKSVSGRINQFENRLILSFSRKVSEKSKLEGSNRSHFLLSHQVFRRFEQKANWKRNHFYASSLHTIATIDLQKANSSENIRLNYHSHVASHQVILERTLKKLKLLERKNFFRTKLIETGS